jgi:tetratricopeptide (TPR) repeat protein
VRRRRRLPVSPAQPLRGASFRAEVLGSALNQLRNNLDPEELAALAQLRDWLVSGRALPAGHELNGFNLLAIRAVKVGRSDLAIDLFDIARELDPSDATLAYDMGNHLSKVGRTDEAVAAYSAALAIDPGFSWARYNRGRLLFDAGDVDDGLADFIMAAQADIDLEGFAWTVGKRIIRERGFVAFRRLITEISLPSRQHLNFWQVLAGAPAQAAAWGGWYLESVIGSEASDDFATVFWRADLSDILRESPLEAFIAPGLHMSRTMNEYHAVQLKEAELLESLWYRPSEWGLAGPEFDRAEHLQRLAEVIDAAEHDRALEVVWAAHYMSGAIALSTLLSGRRDWPTPVVRLSVPCEFRPPSGLFIRPGATNSVTAWIAARACGDAGKEHQPLTCAEFCLKEFRAAAETLLTIRTHRDAPMWTGALVDDEGEPIMAEGEWVRGSAAPELAAEIWSQAEPAFREWVTSSVLAANPAEHIAAVSMARQFNSLAAMELWSDFPSDRWQECRRKIISAYEPEPGLPYLRAALGQHGLLVDFYVHEVVEDTIVRLIIGSDEAEATEVPVDVLAGDLQVLLSAHHPGEMPPEGLAGRVDELLFNAIGSNFNSVENLVIVPFGYLRNVPFHALPALCQAVERKTIASIAYLPSPSFISRFSSNLSQPGRCLFVGVDPSGEIDIDGELSILRSLLGTVTVLRDEDATIENVLAALPQHDTVHFACHGSVDEGIKAGYVELADGRFHSWDVLSTERVPKTVILNACLTSSTESFESTSDEAFGLHSAFLSAGSARVIGGLWEINEWSAKQFARAFYQRWTAGEPVAAAVLQSQHTLRAETSDPFLWAPHAFFGDWR